MMHQVHSANRRYIAKIFPMPDFFTNVSQPRSFQQKLNMSRGRHENVNPCTPKIPNTVSLVTPLQVS